jgi:hypothetical protein
MGQQVMKTKPILYIHPNSQYVPIVLMSSWHNSMGGMQ